MKRYDSYKDSGIEWIGEIPENWSVKKTFHFFKAEKGKKAAQLTKEFCGTIEGIYPVYSGQTENNGIMSSINEYEFNFSDDGCLLSTTVGAKAMSINFIQGKFSLSQNCMVITSRNKSEILNKFFFYQFQPIFNFHRNLIPDHMQPSFRMDDLYQFKIIIPSKEEQNAIANYLDHKTSIIEDLIGKKERLIELLEEERTAIINQAVTKGLDPTVPMKDSGIEWLGEIPAHWGLKRIRFVFEIVKRIAGELGYEVLSVTQQGIKVKDITSGAGQLSMDYSKYQIVEIGDFVMNHMDLLTGYVDKSQYQGVTSPDYRVFRALNEIGDTEFFLYFFQMCYRNKIFFPLGQGSAQAGRWRLPTNQFRDFLIPVPPIDEQKIIVDILQQKLKSIDKSKEILRREIELIKEYKTALISDVVTGKVDVRNEKLN
jgi:type I restriction enzyme S subunit